VQVSVRNAKKDEIGVIDSRAAFGEIGIFDSFPRSSIVQAKSECIIYLLAKQHVEQAVATNARLKPLFDAHRNEWMRWKAQISDTNWKECACDFLTALTVRHLGRVSTLSSFG
jgi:CRP-like cAMP-binding protein